MNFNQMKQTSTRNNQQMGYNFNNNFKNMSRRENNLTNNNQYQRSHTPNFSNWGNQNWNGNFNVNQNNYGRRNSSYSNMNSQNIPGFGAFNNGNQWTGNAMNWQYQNQNTYGFNNNWMNGGYNVNQNNGGYW